MRFLHYVFAASEHGSFHRAAQELGVQASAISRRIRDIEVGLGFDIFRRNHDGVQLTNQGLTWISEVRPHYDALREKTALASSSSEEGGFLRIGVGAFLGKGDIINLLRGLNKSDAPVIGRLADGPCGVHRSKILLRQLDVAFVWEFCSHVGCQSETLWEDRLFVCLKEGHDLLVHNELNWAQLNKERLLVPQGKNGPLFDPCLLKRINDAGRGPRVEYSDAAHVGVLTEVILGVGMTVTGHTFAHSVLPGIAWRPLVGENSAISVKAIWLESNVKPRLRRLIGRARRYASNRIADSK